MDKCLVPGQDIREIFITVISNCGRSRDITSERLNKLSVMSLYVMPTVLPSSTTFCFLGGN